MVAQSRGVSQPNVVDASVRMRRRMNQPSRMLGIRQITCPRVGFTRTDETRNCPCQAYRPVWALRATVRSKPELQPGPVSGLLDSVFLCWEDAENPPFYPEASGSTPCRTGYGSLVRAVQRPMSGNASHAHTRRAILIAGVSHDRAPRLRTRQRRFVAGRAGHHPDTARLCRGLPAIPLLPVVEEGPSSFRGGLRHNAVPYDEAAVPVGSSVNIESEGRAAARR
jgi:hypothetical protein